MQACGGSALRPNKTAEISNLWIWKSLGGSQIRNPAATGKLIKTSREKIHLPPFSLSLSICHGASVEGLVKGWEEEGEGPTYFAVHEKTGHSDSSQLFSSRRVYSQQICEHHNYFGLCLFPWARRPVRTQWEAVSSK